MGKKSAEYVGNPRSNVRASFLRPSVPVAGPVRSVSTIALAPADRLLPGADGMACDDELDLHGKNRKIDAANLDQ